MSAFRFVLRRLQSQWWQRLHAAPSLQPRGFFAYLQAPAHMMGCPTEPALVMHSAIGRGGGGGGGGNVLALLSLGSRSPEGTAHLVLGKLLGAGGIGSGMPMEAHPGAALACSASAGGVLAWYVAMRAAMRTPWPLGVCTSSCKCGFKSRPVTIFKPMCRLGLLLQRGCCAVGEGVREGVRECACEGKLAAVCQPQAPRRLGDGDGVRDVVSKLVGERPRGKATGSFAENGDASSTMMRALLQPGKSLRVGEGSGVRQPRRRLGAPRGGSRNTSCMAISLPSKRPAGRLQSGATGASKWADSHKAT